ncbi:MAG: GFA family protein [Deltaproteobacteria bacterium]|nr:GFA family protein [Deltaproteobacteria bacterium]
MLPGGRASPTPRHTEPAPGKARGSCLCGRAAYEIDLPLAGGGIVNCHCGRCRRARAAAHGANLFLAPEAFRWLRGEDAIAFYKVPDAARFGQSFCTTCGSVMPAAAPTPGRRVVPCGSLDDDPGVRELVHIFVGSKAPWFEISDDLPKHEAYPPAGFPPIARPRS